MEADCWEDPRITDAFRMFLLVVIGGSVCCAGIFLNSCLLVVFSKLRVTNSNLIYLALLASFDIAVEISFILIFIVEHFYDFFHLLDMYLLWHSYVVPISTMGQTLIAASSCLIVAASFERYSASKGRIFKRHQRMVAIGCAMGVAAITRLTVFFELSLLKQDECTGFAYVHVVQSEMTKGWTYSVLYMFWTRNVVNVFLPFALLLFFNSAAISNLTRQRPDDLLMETPPLVSPEGVEGRTSSVKDASRTLVALVSVYLLTNTLNLFITLWEHIDKSSLTEIFDGGLYRYLADISSVLAVTGTALRLPVYYACNGVMRKHLNDLFISIKGGESLYDEKEMKQPAQV